MSPIERFIEVFSRIDRDNLDLLESIYTEDVTFMDPAHSVQGLSSLKRYFEALYENISTIHFKFHRQVKVDSHAFIEWTMTFQHTRLNRGQTVLVEGCSSLAFDADGRVLSHRDYFDLGAMLYEQIPVLGAIIKHIRRRLTS